MTRSTIPLLHSFRWLLLGALLLPAQLMAAVIVPRNLYEGEIQIEAEDPAAREALMRQALGQVLVRVTGDREVAKRKAGIDIMKMAVRLVQQYSYDRRPAPPVKGVAPSVPTAEIKVFRARFDGPALDSQLRARGLPIWGRERPVTKVWLVVEEGGSRLAATESNAAVEVPAVVQAALSRGVPIRLPASAGADDIQNVMQGANAKLAAAAQSAGFRRVLVGRVTQKAAQWSGSWNLFNDGKLEDKWQGTAANRDEALAFGIDQLANAYAARYAVRGGGANSGGALRIDLSVGGVENAADYARVSRYLAGLNGVSSVELIELADTLAIFGLSLRGDRVNLQQSIALGNVLSLDDTQMPAMPTVDAPLSYRLVK